ncbi:MAG: hypothetical protein AB7F86_04940 [Bdellovibrionales bacterium]
MKVLMMSVALLAASVAFAADQSKEISGQITVAKGVKLEPNGSLFIFAKKPGAGGPPAAVLKVPSPKFPLKFTLSAANAMMPGTPFDGPFVVTARFSATGDAMDKSGPQGQDKRSDIKPGQHDIKIELKK